MIRAVLFLSSLVASGASPAESVWYNKLGSGSGQSVTMHNGYISVTYDGSTASLSMGADFSGRGSYTNVLVEPYKLHVKYANGATSLSPTSTMEPTVVQADGVVRMMIPRITDTETNPLIAESWMVTIAPGQRAIDLEIEGEALRDASDVSAVYHGLYMKSTSIYGLFDDRGMAQMMNKTHACLGSDQRMSRAYAVGNGAAMDYVRRDGSSSPSRQVVLSTARKEGYITGIEDIMLGSYPDRTLSYEQSWGECWLDGQLTATTIAAGTKYSASVSFMPNDFDFPVFLISDVEKQPTMPFADIRAYLTGIYASPAGCLQGYYENHHGTIAPTVSHPDVGYSPDTNFFDPDNFISLSALMYSGDSFLLEEARRVLERTSNTMCGLGSEQVDAYCNAPRVSSLRLTTASSLRFGTPSPSESQQAILKGAAEGGRDGQLMHHFVELVPTYESIAGSEQLGPNIFWTWSCLRYISLTQDFNWAVQMFPYMDLSIKYLLTFFDEKEGMIFAPGPLWIDVLVRENYTSDSNAIMVPFLQLAADTYEVMGPLMFEKDSSGYMLFAKELRQISSTIAVSMATALWDAESDDHFITQLDPSGSTRDFVDYDSNLLAVAFGAVSLGAQGDTDFALKRSKIILNRVDSGEYTHVRATWCSEIPYSGDACDCYIVGGTVCGDSVVTLARIGWADAHARRVVGDIETFDSLLLSPLQEDLLQDVWLYERYNETAGQIRTSFYFEYPSLVAMMLREVRYGLSIGLKQVDVNPFINPAVMDREFVYAFGETYLLYSAENVKLRLPGIGKTTRSIKLHGLIPKASYSITDSCTQEFTSKFSDNIGVLEFEWTFNSSECSMLASHQALE